MTRAPNAKTTAAVVEYVPAPAGVEEADHRAVHKVLSHGEHAGDALDVAGLPEFWDLLDGYPHDHPYRAVRVKVYELPYGRPPRFVSGVDWRERPPTEDHLAELLAAGVTTEERYIVKAWYRNRALPRTLYCIGRPTPAPTSHGTPGLPAGEGVAMRLLERTLPALTDGRRDREDLEARVEELEGLTKELSQAVVQLKAISDEQARFVANAASMLGQHGELGKLGELVGNFRSVLSDLGVTSPASGATGDAGKRNGAPASGQRTNGAPSGNGSPFQKVNQ